MISTKTEKKITLGTATETVGLDMAVTAAADMNKYAASRLAASFLLIQCGTAPFLVGGAATHLTSAQCKFQSAIYSHATY